MRIRHVSAVCAAVAVTGAALAPGALAAPAQVEPRTPIRHFLVLMQENHSFDNYFGTYPGADGIPRGTCIPYDPNRPNLGCVKPFRIGNRPIVDLSHNRKMFARQINRGRMDGFVRGVWVQTGKIDRIPMGHYDDRDLPFYWNVADNYVLFDKFFTSSAGGSISNHMYWVTGAPGVTNPYLELIPKTGFTQKTIFDLLEERGISWKFYVQNYDPRITYRARGLGDRASQPVWVPILNYARFLDNPRLSSKIVDLDEYYRDLANGTLPSVAYMVPAGASEHPPGSIHAGQAFVRTLISSLMRSSAWKSSAFMWTYDDWGGWYDHVRPPKVDRFGLGMRAPALLVSPYARRGHVESTTLDFTSVLKFIEYNWRLPALAARDARANNITGAFDFSRPPREAVILGTERNLPPPAQPRRIVVYVAYGLALVATVALLAGWSPPAPWRRRTWWGRPRREASW